MKTIPEKVVDRTWKRLNEATPEDTESSISEMAAAQPFVLAYLLGVEETLGDESDRRGGLLLLGLLFWQALSAENPGMPRISFEQLKKAEEANVKFFEDLDAGSEMDHMNAFSGLMTTYNQAPLLAAGIDALMSGSEEEPEMARESLGLELVHLKTVLDCLDQ